MSLLVLFSSRSITSTLSPTRCTHDLWCRLVGVLKNCFGCVKEASASFLLWQICTTWGWLVLWIIHVRRKLLHRGHQATGVQMMLTCAHLSNTARWIIHCMVVHGRLLSLWRPMQVPCHRHRQVKLPSLCTVLVESEFLWFAVDVQ